MKHENMFEAGLLVGLLISQNQQMKQILELQQQLIAAQQETLALQKKLAHLSPPTPEEDAHWHLVSGGVMSEEAARSNDLEMVTTFYEWLLRFGKKYVQPYVHPKVYGEIINQMTRGVTSHMAALQVEAETKTKRRNAKSSKPPRDDEKDPEKPRHPKQPTLIQ
jgi:tRNA nucleotidyltransferase/poly(A) polymerase